MPYFHPALLRAAWFLFIVLLDLACFSQGWSLDKLKKKEPVIVGIGLQWPLTCQFNTLVPNASFFSTSTYRLYNISEQYSAAKRLAASELGAFIKISKKRFFFKIVFYYVFPPAIGGPNISITFPTYNIPNGTVEYQSPSTMYFQIRQCRMPVQWGANISGTALNKAYITIGVTPSYMYITESSPTSGYEKSEFSDDALYYHMRDLYKNYNLGLNAGFGFQRSVAFWELNFTDDLAHFASKSSGTYLRNVYNLQLVLIGVGVNIQKKTKKIFYE